MSMAEATRFDMLKKPATSQMSKISGVREAHLAQPRTIVRLDKVRFLGELDGEVEHRALARLQIGDAVVQDQRLAELGILRELAHRRPVRDLAVIAPIRRRYRDRDHLALELRQPRFAQHQLVVEPQ